jgi:Ca2+-binding RTX toxin-like protein
MAKSKQIVENRVVNKGLGEGLPGDVADAHYSTVAIAPDTPTSVPIISSLSGEANSAVLLATAKVDTFLGTRANDAASGKGGNDILLGNAGQDTLRGNGGNDLILGGQDDDLLFGDEGKDFLFAEEGNDQLKGSRGNDFLDGGLGNDTLLGGNGNDIFVGGEGNDMLTGERGADDFVFSGNVFSGGTPVPVGDTGIQALNQPDVLTDYQIGKDQFFFNASDLGIDDLVFQKGITFEIASNGNFIVLLDPFVNAATAAQAIAANDAITADEGAFVYFNTTLGINRLVYSQDLGDGGNISVLANLTNQAGTSGLESLASYSASDFSLI